MTFSGLLLKNHHGETNVTDNTSAKGHTILRERMPRSDCEDPAAEPQGHGNWVTAGSNFLIMSRAFSLGEVQFSGTVWVGWGKRKGIHKSHSAPNSC